MLGKQFRGFISYTDEEFKEVWDNAIFVIDTNVIINFYKYKSRDTTKSLLKILKNLKENGRLWIPHQVALEYFFNYEKNMDLQNIGMKKLVEDLSALKDNADKLINKGKSDHPYVDTEGFQFYIKRMESLNKQLLNHYEKEIEKLPDSKKIKEDLLKLLDGITGDPYSQEEINNIEKEGDLRYKDNIPPGFEDMDDKDKQCFRTYGDIKYQLKYGDLIIWNQIIDKVKSEKNGAPIIFITEEKKKDWWEKDGNSIKRPQPQLLQEFHNKTQQKFYMYRIDNFVKNAKKYLSINVTDEQVREVAYDIEGIRKFEELEIKNSDLKEYGNRIINIDSKKYSNAIIKALKSLEFKKENYDISNQIKLEPLFEYLSRKEKYIIKDMINKSYDFELDSSIENHKHSNIFRTAISWSIPNMEYKFKELMNMLISSGIKESNQVNQTYSTLSNDPVERAYELIQGIDSMQALLELRGLDTMI